MRQSITLIILVIAMCVKTEAQVKIPFEKYSLANGLTVLLHEDHSAPLAAVLIQYHVGSKNEKPGRTGFAHLFEHMMFQGSAHVGNHEHFKLLQEVGANVNGFTNEDGTTYFEVLPSNYVELGLYLESDRMGFLLDSMSQGKLDNQRDVVKNERRQNYDNRPYGTADEKIAKAIYPADHPYSWPVIGYMDDLSAASLDDVTGFFKTYYAPSNACLVVAGDLNPGEVKKMIQKYFSDFPRGASFDRPKTVPVSLSEEKRMVFEDKVQLPRLYLTWHSAPNYTREDAALEVLARILSSGKNSRLYKSMVYENQIAQSVSASQGGSEIAGTFQIQITAKPGKNLTQMEVAADSLIAILLGRGITDKEIENALASIESQIVNSASTSLGKGIGLASYYSYTGDPDNINKQMDRYKGMTPGEVQAAASKYLKNPRAVLSIVPVGKTELAAKKGE